MNYMRCCAAAIFSRFANRRFVLAIAAVSLLASKALHVYAHITAFSTGELFHWGITFWAQDIALLLFLRWILFITTRWVCILTTTLSSIMVASSLALASINISFFFVAGSELHWRNIGLAGDSSSWDVLLTGLFSLEVTLVSILVVSWLLQDACFVLTSVALDIVRFPLLFLVSKLPIERQHQLQPFSTFQYSYLPQNESDRESMASQDYEEMEKVEGCHSVSHRRARRLHAMKVGLYLAVGAALCIGMVLSILQPDDSSYHFMSWAVPLLPFVDFWHSSASLTSALPLNSNSTAGDIHNRTALGQPVSLDWLPAPSALPENTTSLPGFEDWYETNKTHYRADLDPLKVSNLNDPLLPELRGRLKEISIRHVVLVKLESTRKDVFPIKQKGQFWEKLEASWENKTLPDEAQKRLANLTATANFLTGDYDDGFEHGEERRRGGINANNTHTTGTYTLKSLAGTLCGIAPLVVDFNTEYYHHVYQPCLAHILNAFNAVEQNKGQTDYRAFKWRSSFMQSTTGGYDKQDKLMPVLGYPNDTFLQGEYLKSDNAKFGKVELEDVNYYGMPEVAIEQYVRDSFQSAKKNDERLFLTHLTSTAHHPFGIPNEEQYVKLNGNKDAENLSTYLNAIGYVDKWLGKLLGILDEEGIAKETLVVMVGDHGLSIPETGSVTPYGQPNVGNFHVPLVFSHPDLPPLDVTDPTNSIQILPSILDMLIESGSLSRDDSRAARGLIENYEGQSIIRPMRSESQTNGEGSWQFTVTNPGGTQIGVRDGRHPEWRIVIPSVSNMEWRFTNPEVDSRETEPIYDFELAGLREKVEEKFGKDASDWVEEAAFVTGWWVEENRRRWRYE